MRAHGAFVMGMQWLDEKLSAATICSEKGGPCRLLTDVPITVKNCEHEMAFDEIENGIFAFGTEAGGEYLISRQVEWI